MLNHGLYTDTLWSVPVNFVDTAGAAVDLSGVEYVATVWLNGTEAFAFKSTGAASDEGTIDTTDAATGVLTFAATETQHAAVAAGLYRLHLVRDLDDDVWAAEASLLIGQPGDRETYLKFDRTVGATVELPILVGGGTGGFALDGGLSGTDYTGLALFDMGIASGSAGGAIDLGSAT
jgi:hypothetical protein